MALATIGISIQQRLKEQKNTSVELVGIPSNFLPFHMRCTANSVLWLNENLKWKETSYMNLLRLMNQVDSLDAPETETILDFITTKIEENKKLSYSSQQHSLILWVEPDGVETLTVFKYLISLRKIPLRIGLLPVLHGEKIYHGALEAY